MIILTFIIFISFNTTAVFIIIIIYLIIYLTFHVNFFFILI